MFLEENKKIKLILASASPRRSDILKLLKINFETIPPVGCNEDEFADPYDTVIKNSIKKSKNIAGCVKISKINSSGGNNYKDIIICGFDTIVYFKDKFFFKPGNREEAKEFISIFSGRTHSVITGLSILSFTDGRIESGFEETKVTFRKLSSYEIDRFLENEDYRDKAGAYNIGGYGAFLVKKINGCFYNVAGLPIFRFMEVLSRFGYDFSNF